MSSALAMVLKAAMAVPGNGPRRVSEEMERGLDLSGGWEGTNYYSNPTQHIALANGKITISLAGEFPCKTRDEGRGRFRLTVRGFHYLGIYKWEGDTVILCVRVESNGRPTSFKPGDDQHLLILHRVKPGK
jgi:hypothetical protein